MLTSVRSKIAAALLAGCTLAATPAFADETDPPSDITVTGSASLVSQYRFRGLAQSDNKPAVQASMTIAHSSGFYISTWGSSASAGSGPINIGGTEIDDRGLTQRLLRGREGLAVLGDATVGEDDHAGAGRRGAASGQRHAEQRQKEQRPALHRSPPWAGAGRTWCPPLRARTDEACGDRGARSVTQAPAAGC